VTRRTVGDAHCHLSLLADPDRAVGEALSAGVAPILALGMDADEAEAVLSLRDRHRGSVLAGVGLHPSRVVELPEAELRVHLRRIEQLAPEAEFIGEIGLDYKDATTPEQRAAQREVLGTMLELASDLRRPVNLHTRRAGREVLDAASGFRSRTGLGALLHWFTRSKKLARLCAERGIFISAGPSVLTSEPAAGVARSIEDDILLVETDAPVAYGELGSARPAWAARVLGRLAELRSTPSAELGALVQGNLERYLGKSRLGND
jgi:TatD DNase family protein